MKALVLDGSVAGEARLLHVRLAAPLVVHAAWHLFPEEGRQVIDTVADEVRRNGLEGLPVYLIPPRELVKDQIFHFPPMPERELRKILPREIAQQAGTAAAVTFAFTVLGKVVEKGAEKQEVQVFYGESEALAAEVRRWREAGLHVAAVVPEVQSLMSFFELNPEWVGAGGGAAVAEVREHRIHLHLCRSVHWVLSREFTYRMKGSADLGEEDLGRIVMEMNRTFQFFKQKHRGYPIERILFFGASSALAEVREYVCAGLSLECGDLHAGLLHNRVVLPRTVADEREFLKLFFVPLFIALAANRKTMLDLLPEGVVPPRHLRRRLIGWGIVVGLAAAGMAGTAFYLEGLKRAQRREIEAVRRTSDAMAGRMQVIEATKARRIGYYRSRLFRDYAPKYSFAAADFIRRLGLLAVPELHLQELQIVPAGSTCRFTLNGSLRAGDNVAVQSLFLQFFQGVKTLPSVAQISYSEVKVANREEEAGLAAESAAAAGVELFFAVQGVLELE